ncbi:hypothetical protein [Halobacillus litoralis]|uniref:Uncharacterized protein n=1 Tax=Halobacillus litoralis TaxID=45668 RepID=A0A410MCI3_9BACI|nr:hypothetical protein [Halobacillus litoralis]QAS52410.1 hypothetical protein HLI_09270 [Halobacillus litoralis]
MTKFIVKEVQEIRTEFEVEAPNAQEAINEFHIKKRSKNGSNSFGAYGSFETHITSNVKREVDEEQMKIYPITDQMEGTFNEPE